MIITILVNDPGDEAQREAELLEVSWQQCGQSGELLRLLCSRPGLELPRHALARVEAALPWERHPYIDDTFKGYNVPAALLEWLLREPLDSTVLVMGGGSVMREAVTRELSPGKAIACHWENFPEGPGPFGLPDTYSALRAYCVQRDLPLPKIRLPLLIHSTDLLKICPRWLELLGLLRTMPGADSQPESDYLNIALAIAATEYQLTVNTQGLSQRIAVPDDPAYPELSTTYDSARSTGAYLTTLRPVRQPGVRQACVLDHYYLELGAADHLMSLNRSASEIWQLCDGQKTVQDIIAELENRYQTPYELMAPDVINTVIGLKSTEALKLEVHSK
ncbi:PqqD family protein [Luminiphilus syltensis]|uniref:PqqD family protein n=1 Tax=Luminiphilus syltensis TaxID=1341119 RepID=UPI0002D73122|nr:PqqD family protein [Luminiphilus syltensis]